MEQGSLPCHWSPFIRWNRTRCSNLQQSQRALSVLWWWGDWSQKQTCMPSNAWSMWSTTSDDFRAYIGLHIWRGINRLPEIRDYWVKDDKLHYTPIASRISRSRFEAINRYTYILQTTHNYHQGRSKGTKSATCHHCNEAVLHVPVQTEFTK